MQNDTSTLVATASPHRGVVAGRASEHVFGRLPILPRTYLSRHRLQAALEDATADSGITLLVAPAGAGKTLGVAGWLHDQHLGEGTVWLASGRDLVVDDLAHVTSLRDGSGSPRLVVVDDAHELPPECTAWLDDRLNQDPEQLRVLLLSRWDLPLSRLVPELLGHLTVLRGGLLRLDEAETSYLVAHHARTESAEVARMVRECAEGWCAAVVLSARAVAGSARPGTALRDPRSGLGVVDRVAGEAFAALTPRQRHVVLCVAAEPMVSPSMAQRLSHDPAAGRVLEELEATGLLVSRWTDALPDLRRNRSSGPLAISDPSRSTEPDEPRFLLHPLLVEVARRRLVAGGVDVQRARSTVRRTVELDLERGEVRHALRRLVTMGDLDAVNGVLSAHGPALVLDGRAREISRFVRHHPDVVEECPSSWFTLALERWQSGDFGKARSWLHRLSTVPSGSCRVDGVATACASLMRGCAGDASLPDAVVDGRRLLLRLETSGSEPGPELGMLRLLLGTAQLRLGDLEAAEHNLGAAADVQRRGLPSTLARQATGQLALLQLLRGREHTASELARRAAPGDAGPVTEAALRVARDFAGIQSAVHTGSSKERGAGGDAMSGPVEPHHVGDPVVDVLSQLLRARRLLLAGRAASAARSLEAGVAVVDIPYPLRAAVLLERGLQATLSADHDRLRRVADELSDLGMSGEAALVEGWRADLLDDLAKAAGFFAEAADTATCTQPPVAALAWAGRAQVLDAMGYADKGLLSLDNALRATEVRRTVLPFLGWSRHGRNASVVMAATTTGRPTSSWAADVRGLLDGYAGIAALAGPMTATPQEQAHVVEALPHMALSPRERDVLHELARGSTYADIAANLFVSENTVKTHVSSLYAKLGVNRRSDALAMARTLRLL